ncbi:RCC1/BLIP-II [Gymnopus androsaceus JB14]|uniref:RCC1/BLIP-II n=1 Tax=Gymnopus androsaceus JB14 TaxID=1447944 RepID=A0A6A4HRG8_9AGAR|nr:RCC1/BLIP-II [Gymnopus androsaceus JB14]
MLSVTDIPIEIFLDNLLHLLPLNDLLSLQGTNKFFAALCSDETFWKQKLSQDFNFPDETTARTSGWKFIYSLFGHGRMGQPVTTNNVPFPLELKFPGTRIVNLAAAGMSFHALDSDGCIHVWGTLNGTSFALNRDGFSESGKVAAAPLKLQLPASIRSISWGRPFRLASDLLNTRDFTPIQVECGWNFSSALTKSGAVLVWLPFSDPMRTAIETKMGEMDNQGGSGARSTDDGLIEWFDNALVGLTNQGHVLLFDSISDVSRGNWQYLPNFSEASRIGNHPTFSDGELKASENFKITHVSAHFRTFIAYSESVVLIGQTGTKPDSKPKIIPGLQNRSVISVVLGDYHYAAVTATGKLLTWGGYSDGALGLVGTPGGFADEAQRVHAMETRRGTPPHVDSPTEVRFDHHRKRPKDRFCISATASGWHTGALVIDLEASIHITFIAC